MIISITGARGGIFDIGNIDVEFPAGKYIYFALQKDSLTQEYVEQNLLQITNEVETSQYLKTSYTTAGRIFYEDKTYLLFEASDFRSKRVYLALLEGDLRYPKMVMIYYLLDDVEQWTFNIFGQNLHIYKRVTLENGEVKKMTETYDLTDNFKLLERDPDLIQRPSKVFEELEIIPEIIKP